eukprot:g36587.t1
MSGSMEEMRHFFVCRTSLLPAQCRLQNDNQNRDRERVGPAVNMHYREMGRELLQTLGLPEGSTWRSVADQKIRIPQQAGRVLVDRLMQGRADSQEARGRNTWTSADASRAMDTINPITAPPPDWRVPFRQLSSNSKNSASSSSSRGSTAGRRKLRLAHNPGVEPMLDDIYGEPASRVTAFMSASSSSSPSPTFMSASASSSPSPAYMSASSSSSPSPAYMSASSSSSSYGVKRESSSSSSPPPLSPARSSQSVLSSQPLSRSASSLSSASSLVALGSSAVVVKREEGVASSASSSSLPIDIDCRICHSPIDDIKFEEVRDVGKRQALLTCCNVSYHRNCIERWWNTNNENGEWTFCPLCKKQEDSYLTSYKYGHERIHWVPREYVTVDSGSDDDDWWEDERVGEQVDASFEGSGSDDPWERVNATALAAAVKAEPELKSASGTAMVLRSLNPPAPSPAAVRKDQDEEYERATVIDIASASLQEAKTKSSQKREETPQETRAAKAAKFAEAFERVMNRSRNVMERADALVLKADEFGRRLKRFKQEKGAISARQSTLVTYINTMYYPFVSLALYLAGIEVERKGAWSIHALVHVENVVD